MGSPKWAFPFRWRQLFRIRPWFFLIGVLGVIRLSKGAGLLDAFAYITGPLSPGSAQREWIQKGVQLENRIRLELLAEDNQRLREILDLTKSSDAGLISAAVISRQPVGWWQQLDLGKGRIHGIKNGDVVLGPGGLLGIIQSVTPTTSRVRLLTAPGSRIGVWTSRNKRHGILMGMGSNRPSLRFLDKDSDVVPGDVVSTSPASTLMPPNVPVGVVQVVNTAALPAPIAVVQLTASPEAIDWVQIWPR